MIIDKIVVIAAAIIGIIYLSVNFIIKKRAINILVIAIQTFFVGLYISANIYNIVIPIYIEAAILTFGIVLPFVVCLLEIGGLRLFGGIKSLNGYFLYKIGKYDRAIEGLKVSSRKNPDNTKMLKALAETHKQLKEFEKARDIYAKIVEIDKKDADAYYNLAYILENLNKCDSAKLMYLQCLKLQPKNIDALESLSLLEANAGNSAEALKLCDKILEIEPKKYEAHFNKAIIFTQMRELEEAIMSYEKALAENPKLYDAEYNIGQISYVKGDYEKAERAFKNSIHSDTYKIKGRYYLAKIYAILKERKKAMDNLKYVMDNDTNYIMEAREDVIFQEMYDFIEEYIVDTINATTSVNMSSEASQVDLEDVRRKNYGIGFFNR